MPDHDMEVEFDTEFDMADIYKVCFTAIYVMKDRGSTFKFYDS